MKKTTLLTEEQVAIIGFCAESIDFLKRNNLFPLNIELIDKVEGDYEGFVSTWNLLYGNCEFYVDDNNNIVKYSSPNIYKEALFYYNDKNELTHTITEYINYDYSNLVLEYHKDGHIRYSYEAFGNVRRHDIPDPEKHILKNSKRKGIYRYNHNYEIEIAISNSNVIVFNGSEPVLEMYLNLEYTLVSPDGTINKYAKSLTDDERIDIATRAKILDVEKFNCINDVVLSIVGDIHKHTLISVCSDYKEYYKAFLTEGINKFKDEFNCIEVLVDGGRIIVEEVTNDTDSIVENVKYFYDDNMNLRMKETNTEYNGSVETDIVDYDIEYYKNGQLKRYGNLRLPLFEK